MFKRIIKKRKHNNQGNTYIMVVATLSFLAVLVAAILVAVALCYRLKAYDINARDNFYFLEQAMDEIYAGVGADAMDHLNKAYDDTVEVLVYFDAASQSYVTMKNDEANVILKNSYITRVKNDKAYQTKDSIKAHLYSFMSKPYYNVSFDKNNNKVVGSYSTVADKEGIQLNISDTNPKTSDDSVTIQNLVLKREAKYSTVNTRAATEGNGDTFVQTITTDLVIGKPEFDVNFNTIGSELNDLYGFALVADKGVEIGDAAAKVNITGNVYAASDFYNKDYNKTDKEDGKKNNPKYATVSAYDENKDEKEYEDRYKACDGLSEKSMYSGLYINGADVIISADRLIVPGTIAAFNGANLAVAGSNQNQASSSEIWADSITLGGYSFKRAGATSDDDVVGSKVNMRANAYISDDLELNAKASSFKLIGSYYGYNYASTDNRTFSEEFIKRNNSRTFVDNVKDTISDAATLEGQAHYNSSSIIINGADSELDLSLVDHMYIAGQSYIETSKTTKKHNLDPEIEEDAKNNSKDNDDFNQKVAELEKEKSNLYNVVNKSGENEVVSYNTYDYPSQSVRTVKETVKVTEEDGSVVKDEDGNDKTKEVTTEVADNYTTNTANRSDAKKNTNIQDYRTGEAISIKSNQLAYQLAYIPSSSVHDTTEGLYVDLPASLRDLDVFKNNWDNLSRIPVIKTVISGKSYYFFDFSTDATTKAGVSQDVMNSFIAAYADLFKLDSEEEVSKGESHGLTDITDYSSFKVKTLLVNTNYYTDDKGNKTRPKSDESGNFTNIYSNSAITVKTDTNFTIKSKSSSIDPLISAAQAINQNLDTQKTLMENDTDKGKVLPALSDSRSQSASGLANSVTTSLQSQYKEVKWMLTTKSGNAAGLEDAHTNMKESELTPLNYFFYFNKIKGSDYRIVKKLNSGYKVWVSDEDITIDSSDFKDEKGKVTGDVKGLVICKGDVDFDKSVKSFEGLIVTGSKVIINPSNTEKKMNISSNEEIIKTILRECDEAQNSVVTDEKKLYKVCELFQQYQSVYKPSADDDVAAVSAKSISAVQFEDILGFENWKKNVD